MKKTVIILSTLFTLVAFFTTSAPALEMGGVDIHGFVSQGFLLTTDDIQYMVPETDEGLFEFNEMGINFSGRPAGASDNLTIGAQFLAFDFGNVGNHEVTIDWAYGDYAFRDYLGVRAGIIKTPHGLYNETRKIDMLRASIFLPTSVYPEWLREAMTRSEGVGIYGTLFNSLSYQLKSGHVSLKSDGGMAKAFGTLLSGFTVTDMDSDETHAAALQWDTPLSGLKLGTTWISLNLNEINMTGNTDSAVPLPVYDLAGTTVVGMSLAPIALNATLYCEPIESFVLSGEYQRDRLTVTTEYVQYDLEFDMDVNTTSDTTLVTMAAMGGDPDAITLNNILTTIQHSQTTLEGYYGQISYRLLDNLEIGTYYSEMYWDKNDRNGSEYSAKYGKPRYGAYIKDTCLSVRYDFTPNWCAKAETHLMDGSLFALNNPDDKWQMYAAKLSYLF